LYLRSSSDFVTVPGGPITAGFWREDDVRGDSIAFNLPAMEGHGSWRIEGLIDPTGLTPPGRHILLGRALAQSPQSGDSISGHAQMEKR
jgi:hypothetical protein